MKKAFTLIELLVVVLIIGILAAIALPQYQKAVERSKASQAFVLLKSLQQSVASYYLANGTYPTSFSDLETQVPWTGNKKFHSGTAAADTRSNQDWSLQLFNDSHSNHEIWLGRISGPYAGSGFIIGMSGTYWQCQEKISSGVVFKKNPGDYCIKIINAPGSPNTLSNGRYYYL